MAHKHLGSPFPAFIIQRGPLLSPDPRITFLLSGDLIDSDNPEEYDSLEAATAAVQQIVTARGDTIDR